MYKSSENINSLSLEISMLIAIEIGKEINKEMGIEIFNKVGAELELVDLENMKRDECLKIINKLFKNPEFHKDICRRFELSENKYQGAVAKVLDDPDYHQAFCDEYFKRLDL